MSNPAAQTAKPDPASGQIIYGRIGVALDAEELVLTHYGASGSVSVRVDAAKLERWAMRVLREEAFAL